VVDTPISESAIVGAGIGKDARALSQFVALLGANAAQPIGLHSSSFRLTVLVPENDVDRITRAAHTEFVNANGS
jgi:aspartokinase